MLGSERGAPLLFKIQKGEEEVNQGVLSGVLGWGTHPTYSKGTAAEWFWGAILIIIVAFLWTLVLKEIREV